MTLPVNTAIALNPQIAQRLVAASLAGNNAHALRVNTPPGIGTVTQLEALYTRQYCVQLGISSDEPIIPMITRVQDAVAKADKEKQSLAIIASCRSNKEACAIASMLAPQLVGRESTALVTVVTEAADAPTVTHYLTLEDAKATIA